MIRKCFSSPLFPLLLCVMGPAAALHAQTPMVQPKMVMLWPDGAPGALGNTPVDKPRMYIFLPEKRTTSASVLVIPGGGYHTVVVGSAGFQMADWLNRQGVAAD